MSEVVGGFCQDVTHQKIPQSKDWIDSTVQKNPSENDYQLIGTVSVSGPNFTIDVILKAPGGNALWSKSFGAALRQINLVSDTVANQISSQIFLEIMKVRDKFKS